jgi:hypothetical protein
LELTLDGETSVNAVEISFHEGDSRVQLFDLYVDGSPVLLGGESSGDLLTAEFFPFSEKAGRKLTFMGHGNSIDRWNTISEIVVCGTSIEKNHDDSKLSGLGLDCNSVRKLGISSIEASSDDGNVARNVLDGDLLTMWSAEVTTDQFITLKLDTPSLVSELSMGVFIGNKRTLLFDVDVKTSLGWEDVLIDGQSVNGGGLESYTIGVKDVEELKIVCYGSKDTETGEYVPWSSITEIELFGC